MDSSWNDIFPKNEYDTIMSQLSNIEPKKELVLKSFEYCPVNKITVIILGQDPYPRNATGLAFSSEETPIPPTLRNIYKCLDIISNSGNLSWWAVQGVLLLNTALTTEVGISGSHIKLWKPFTIQLLTNLTKFHESIGNKLHFMLWGEKAKEYKQYLGSYHNVLEWRHPSPLSEATASEQDSFLKCDHFKLCNFIDWNNHHQMVIFTDGACSKNGKTNAIASFATLCFVNPTLCFSIHGLVPAREFVCKDGIIMLTDTVMTPTNNRAELLAICMSLSVIKLLGMFGNIIIVTDSKYSIDSTNYYRARKMTSNFGEFKNTDLFEIIDNYKTGNISYTHQPSHTPEPVVKTDTNYMKWKGNFKADESAGEAIAQKTELKIKKAPYIVHKHYGVGWSTCK